MIENNNPEINVQDLMLQNRDELARKIKHEPDGNAKMTQYIHEGIVLNRIPENKVCIADKPKYTVADFLEYQDDDFIRSAYRGILRREPDASGYDHYGYLLYTGQMSKIEILGRLRYSAEGRSCAVPVRGLLKPFLARSAFRLPVLGATAAIASAFVKLPTIVRNQVSFENYTYRHQREHVEQINIIADQIESAIAKMQKSFVSLTQTIDTQAIKSELIDKSLQGVILALASKAGNEQVVALSSQLSEMTQSKANVSDLTDTRNLLTTELQQKADKAQLEAKADNEQLIQLNDQLVELIQRKADATELAITSELLLAELEQKAGIDQMHEFRSQTTSKFEELIQNLDGKTDSEQMTQLSNHLNKLLQRKVDNSELTATSNLLFSELKQKVDNGQLEAYHTQFEDKLQRLNLELEAKPDNEQVLALSSQLSEMTQSKANVSDLTETFNLLTAELQQKADKTQLEAKADNEQVLALSSQLSEMTQSKAKVSDLTDTRNLLTTELQQKADKAQLDGLNLATENKLNEFTLTLDQKLDAATIEQDIQEIKRQIYDQKHNSLDQHRRLAILLEEARKRLPKPFSQKQLSNMVAEEDHLLDAFYVSFEDQFRGTRADIKQRLADYLPLVKAINAGTAKAPILDMGCGRGEWLELLQENELIAKGVDSNRVMVSQCQELGLEVINNDAIEYLRTLNANSLGAVTGMHIIEHIPFKRLIALFDEVLRVLKPGGVAIFETPNPENLIVGACNFYFDPTHLNPLPPEPMRFVMEARGFGSIEILRLHPYPEEFLLTEGAEQVQKTLNQLMYGPQDYALVAYKS